MENEGRRKKKIRRESGRNGCRRGRRGETGYRTLR
jgi:hypothetical protein